MANILAAKVLLMTLQICLNYHDTSMYLLLSPSKMVNSVIRYAYTDIYITDFLQEHDCTEWQRKEFCLVTMFQERGKLASLETQTMSHDLSSNNK